MEEVQRGLPKVKEQHRPLQEAVVELVSGRLTLEPPSEGAPSDRRVDSVDADLVPSVWAALFGLWPEEAVDACVDISGVAAAFDALALSWSIGWADKDGAKVISGTAAVDYRPALQLRRHATSRSGAERAALIQHVRGSLAGLHVRGRAALAFALGDPELATKLAKTPEPQGWLLFDVAAEPDRRWNLQLPARNLPLLTHYLGPSVLAARGEDGVPLLRGLVAADHGGDLSPKLLEALSTIASPECAKLMWVVALGLMPPRKWYIKVSIVDRFSDWTAVEQQLAQTYIAEHPDLAERVLPEVELTSKMRALAQKRLVRSASSATANGETPGGPTVAAVVEGSIAPEELRSSLSPARLEAELRAFIDATLPLSLDDQGVERLLAVAPRPAAALAAVLQCSRELGTPLIDDTVDFPELVEMVGADDAGVAQVLLHVLASWGDETAQSFVGCTPFGARSEIWRALVDSSDDVLWGPDEDFVAGLFAEALRRAYTWSWADFEAQVLAHPTARRIAHGLVWVFVGDDQQSVLEDVFKLVSGRPTRLDGSQILPGGRQVRLLHVAELSATERADWHRHFERQPVSQLRATAPKLAMDQIAELEGKEVSPGQLASLMEFGWWWDTTDYGTACGVCVQLGDDTSAYIPLLTLDGCGGERSGLEMFPDDLEHSSNALLDEVMLTPEAAVLTPVQKWELLSAVSRLV